MIVALTLLLALLGAACSDDSDTGTPTAVPTASIPDSATLPPASGSAVDLASAAPLLTAHAVDTLDLSSDQPGLAVADFSGDGIADFAVGARFADRPGADDAGAVYIVFGADEPPSAVDFATSEQDVTVLGPAEGAGLGLSAAAGDLNGDGDADLIVAAPFNAAENAPHGSLYIIFGPLEAGASFDLAQDEADVTIHGATTGGLFGDSLATGDFNGDGTIDLAAGAPFAAEDSSGGEMVGAVYLFLGRPSWPATLASADADSVIYGRDELDELGDFVSAGDLNGDGVTDLIATAEAADGPGNSRAVAGEVLIFYGRPDFERSYGPGDEDVLIYGARENDTLGFSTAAGDLNGDGVDDLAMSARLAAAEGVERAGVVWALYGGSDLPEEIDTASPPDFLAAIGGAARGDLLATSMTIADLSSDGTSELILGGSFADARGRSDAGSLYLLDAADLSGFVRLADAGLTGQFDGSAAGEQLGGNVAAGDFNGDGRLDIVAVAEGGQGPAADRRRSGRVYVLSP